MDETHLRLPAPKSKFNHLKHCLWIDFKTVKLDGRTALARAINKLRRELVNHLGGKPSIAETILIERVVHKSMKAFIYETEFFLNKDQGSRDHYLALVNSLRLDLQALGLKQNEKKVLDLGEYIQKKAKGGSHESH